MSAPELAVRDARLLIVDDEPENLALLEEIFGNEGFQQVLSTVDATQVPALVQSYRPDLVLLDLRMPDVDGYSLLGLIEAQRRGRQLDSGAGADRRCDPRGTLPRPVAGRIGLPDQTLRSGRGRAARLEPVGDKTVASRPGAARRGTDAVRRIPTLGGADAAGVRG